MLKELIEKASTDAEFDEIDARLWCLLNDEDFIEVDHEYTRYTRSVDACLEVIESRWPDLCVILTKTHRGWGASVYNKDMQILGIDMKSPPLALCCIMAGMLEVVKQ